MLLPGVPPTLPSFKPLSLKTNKQTNYIHSIPTKKKKKVTARAKETGSQIHGIWMVKRQILVLGKLYL